MKKRSIIILSAAITVIAISAFGLTEEHSTLENVSQSDSTNIQLADIGINGGLNIDIRTGLKTEFVADKNGPDLAYIVRGYTDQSFLRSIPKQKLIDAKEISDVIENYPSSFIQDYNSITISGIVNGEDIEASTKNATLSEDQKEILVNAPEVFISVQYQKKNYNDKVQNRVMNVSLVITPETSAEFKGGYMQLIEYLKDNCQGEIAAKNFRYLPQPSVNFIINEEGYPESVVLKSSSKDDEIDKLLIEVIKDMPKWEPGSNAEGQAVKQKFTLDIGQNGC